MTEGRHLCGIVADDLAGACDSAAPFAQAGQATVVTVEPHHVAAARDMAVLACVTSSRSLEPRAALARTRRVAATLRRLDVDWCYKKVDSTLRGNVGAELEGALAGTGGSLVVLAPAFPACGRTTLHGVQYVAGVPLHRVRDASERPIFGPTARVAELVARQTGLRVRELWLPEVREGVAALAGHIRRWRDEGAGVLLVDAERDADLDALARALLLVGPSGLLPAGSAGLAAALARCALPRQGQREGVAIPAVRGVLILAGSRSAVTAAQVGALTGACAVAPLEVPTTELLAGRPRAEAVTALLARAAAGRLAMGQVATVVPSSGDARGLAPPALVAHGLGGIGRKALEMVEGPVGLVLTGGDTALAALQQLGAHGIRLVRELQPGIPLGLLQGGERAGYPVVSKAGAFGNEQTLLHVVEHLMGEELNR